MEEFAHGFHRFAQYPSPISSVRLFVEYAILLLLCAIGVRVTLDATLCFTYPIAHSFYFLILLILPRVRCCSSKERVAADAGPAEIPYILDLTQPPPIKTISPELWRFRLCLYDDGRLSDHRLTNAMAAGFSPDE
jgi:hypothetical protein